MVTIIRQILDEGAESEDNRPVPSAPAVEASDVSTVPGGGATAPSVLDSAAITSPSTAGNFQPSVAQSLVQTEQPAQRPHPTLSYPSLPDTFSGQGIEAVDQAVRADLQAARVDASGGIVADMYAVGELQRSLRSQYNRHVTDVIPSRQAVEANINPPPTTITDYFQKRKEESLQRNAIPSTQPGFSGVTRTLNDRNPLSTTSRAAITDAMEAERQGTPDRIEPVFPVSPVDNAIARTIDITTQAIPGLGILPAFSRPLRRALGLPTSVEDVRDIREDVSALSTLARVRADQLIEDTQERVEEVGVGGLFLDGAVNFASMMAETYTGGVALDSQQVLPEFLENRLPSTPLPAEEVSQLGDNTITQSIERNPAVENLFRRIGQAFEPTEGVDISRGQYGEFGSTPLSAIFYALSLPEGLLQATAYSVADRYFLPEEFGTPNRFAEVLLEGRDLSITQEFTEDKYLSLIGNPVFGLAPVRARPGRRLQTLAGFAVDLAVGGVADKALERVFMFGGRAIRTGTRRITDTVRPPVRSIDDAVQRSADTVLRRPSVPGDDVARLNFQIDNTLRNLPVEDNAKVLVPEVETALKRFGVDDARPYRLRTAISDIADERQLSLPFVNTRRPLTGTAIRRGLRAVGAGDIVEETQELIQLRSIDERVTQIQQLINSSPQRAREVVAPPEQIAEQLTLEQHQQALANTIQEQQAITRRISMSDAEIVAMRINDRAEADGLIRVENNGFIFQSEPDELYDTVLPTVPLEQVQPRNVDSVSDFLVQYRYAPDSVNELDMNLVRRNDTTLANLGRVWNVENGVFRLPETDADQLSNFYRARALEDEYPTLLARFGKPVSNRIEAPILRIDLSSQFDTDEIVTAIPAIETRPQQLLLPPADGQQVRREVNKLQRRILTLSDQVKQNLVRNDVEAALKLRDQLEDSTNSLFHLYADNPEIAADVALARLPNSTRPIGPASSALGERYIATQQRFFYEAEVLSKLRQDLFEVTELLDQQRRVVAESPLLERVPVLHEIATKRNQGLTSRTASAEMAQPGPDIRIPQLIDLIGDRPTAFERVREFEEFAPLTDEQLRRAINNDGRVFLDNDGVIRPAANAPIESAPSVTPEVSAIQGLREQFDNFIPLFAVRDTPEFASLSRQQQDEALRALQRQDIIEMSTLQDVTQYTPEQQAAGIPNPIGGDDFFVILSDDLPVANANIVDPEMAEVERVVDIGTTVSLVVRDSGLSEERVREIVESSPRLRFDERDPNFIFPTEFPEVEDFAPVSIFDLDDVDPVVRRDINYDSYNSLARVSKTLADGEEVAVALPNNVKLILERVRGSDQVFIDFFVEGKGFRPGESDPTRALGFRRGLAEMRTYLDNVMKANPNYRYTVSSIGGGSVGSIDDLSEGLGRALLNNTPLSEEQFRELASGIGEKYSKYKQYHKYGFRLIEGDEVDTERALSITDFTRFFVDNGDSMRFGFNPADGLRGTRRKTGVVTTHYHGTKATSLDVPASSASNEFGPGLYVSRDKNMARRFARATPAKDLIDTGTLTPRFTNQGRIFPIETSRDFNAINIRNLTEQQRGDLSDIFRQTLRNRAEHLVPRFDSWSRRHEPHEWWHYIRSQFMRESGGSVLDYVEFSENVRDQLRLLGIDGIRDGDTTAIINPAKITRYEPFEDADSTGGIGEGLLNRYAADYDLHNRMKNSTTESIIQQDRLAIDEFAHSQLEKSVREQQVVTTRATREYNRTSDQLEAAVTADKRRQNRIRRDELGRSTVNQHNRVSREVSDIPKEC